MLIYGSRTMLLVEFAIHTHWVTTFQEDLNNKTLSEALDFLPMVRGDTYLKEEIVKIRMTHF